MCSMDNALYFSLQKIMYSKTERLKLSQICSVLGADPKPLENAFLEFDQSLRFTAFDAAQRLSQLYPGYTINNLGPEQCDIFLAHTNQTGIKTIIKTALFCIIMFFGGAVALITFHEDVNMRNVHLAIGAFFNGQAHTNLLIVSIPYTAGIVIGFTVLLSLLSRKRKRASVLDIDIYEYETSLRNFLAAKNDRPDG